MSIQPTQLFQDIVRGNFHSGGLKCLKLFKIDHSFFLKLKEECLELTRRFSPSDVTHQDHITNWTQPFGRSVQFSLLNASGQLDDTKTDHNRSILGKQFHYAQDFPTINTWIQQFPHAINMRLNGMGKNSGLSPHEEHILEKDKARRKHFLRVRFHLPVFTNDQCEMLLDGELYHFEEGYLYFFNNGTIHSARNLGETLRLHFVWDMLLTEDTYARMFNSAFKNEYLEPIPADQQKLTRKGIYPMNEYAISGTGEKLYRQFKLGSLGIKPYRFQNLWTKIVRQKKYAVDFAPIQ